MLLAAANLRLQTSGPSKLMPRCFRPFKYTNLSSCPQQSANCSELPHNAHHFPLVHAAVQYSPPAQPRPRPPMYTTPDLLLLLTCLIIMAISLPGNQGTWLFWTCSRCTCQEETMMKHYKNDTFSNHSTHVYMTQPAKQTWP